MTRKRKRNGYSDRQKFAILREEMRVFTQGEKSGSEFNAVMTVFVSAIAVMLVSMLSITSVRALLTAVTDEKHNLFAPMTYTNTQINEDNTTFEDDFSGSTVSIKKSATVENLSGADKKPVFVRVGLTYSVYDSEGVNISSDYPVNSFTVSFNGSTSEAILTDASLYDSGKWTKCHDYYYYNSILNPGESTSELFGSGTNVTLVLKDNKTLPDDATVEIDVIADTVQAVSHDSANWVPADYEKDDVNRVWGTSGKGATATIKEAGEKPVTWKPA